jgi:hypothetical protein
LNLKIRGVDFVANLILLESKGIDVTLEIWLVKQAQGTHKSTEKSIKLTTLNRNELEYIAEPVIIAKGATNKEKPVVLGERLPLVDCLWCYGVFL